MQRPGTAADRLAIEHFRYEIYVAEQGKQYPTADHPARRLSDIFDAVAVHFVLRDEYAIAGYLRVHPDMPDPLVERFGLAPLRDAGERIGHISRLKTDPGRKARASAATVLLRAAYEEMAQTNVVPIVGHTAPALLPLWSRFGTRAFGENFALEGVRRQQPIVLLMGEVSHLAAIKSPLAMCVQRLVGSGRMARVKRSLRMIDDRGKELPLAVNW